MKQHINLEQLNELSKDSNSKLRLWVYKKTYESPEICQDTSMLLSIGQMIEFLDEHYGAWMMESWQEWTIINQENNKFDGIGKSKELCDALWEAVKEVLSQ